MYKKIGFIGLGLIGGSIAKNIKRVFPEIALIGLSGHESTIKAAHDDGVLDNDTNASPEEIASCDLIFLCTPVQKNLEYLSALKPLIGPDTIITDVGSVKGDINNMVESLGLESSFIGGHPMAGTENSGYAYANAYLIENAYYILTVTDKISETHVKALEDFIKALGAIPITMTPKEHDYATAAISHLPHVLAAALVNLVRESDTKDEVMKTIAAGGFKDITRIASSSSVMWQNICLENKDEILRLIDGFTAQFKDMRSRIESADADGIFDFFKTAKDYRDSFTVNSKNGIRFELFIDLIDKAGGIATIATLLANNNINIKNIGIVHNREFEQGVLHIELYDKPSLDKTVDLLRNNSYTVYER
ncbi:MAG: prephenate dehydrogenase/arogenate dehydrogenase family protein [Lachnospiraceae bacterium]|nr:prephenate dehydrogenase/arogenate dehydrogenase family protein [Lachnospiraceae bacterium]